MYRYGEYRTILVSRKGIRKEKGRKEFVLVPSVKILVFSWMVVSQMLFQMEMNGAKEVLKGFKTPTRAADIRSDMKTTRWRDFNIRSGEGTYQKKFYSYDS